MRGEGFPCGAFGGGAGRRARRCREDQEMEDSARKRLCKRLVLAGHSPVLRPRPGLYGRSMGLRHVLQLCQSQVCLVVFARLQLPLSFQVQQVVVRRGFRSYSACEPFEKQRRVRFWGVKPCQLRLKDLVQDRSCKAADLRSLCSCLLSRGAA